MTHVSCIFLFIQSYDKRQDSFISGLIPRCLVSYNFACFPWKIFRSPLFFLSLSFLEFKEEISTEEENNWRIQTTCLSSKSSWMTDRFTTTCLVTVGTSTIITIRRQERKENSSFVSPKCLPSKEWGVEFDWDATEVSGYGRDFCPFLWRSQSLF